VASDRVLVSAASVWEIEIKRALDKLEAPTDLLAQIDASGFTSLPIAAEHAVLAGRLPPYHRDPFGRMLIAQAMHLNVPLVSADEQFDAYPVARLWG
jgi:PIN domain nuclease of toxin-antitoxin system